ncbi:hypothetical protein OsJ_16963 [Oryza sativa Japonica Group]|uniref:Legume lectin domain-containing protein n=1 Tax=Oryza sativa subsp. japonica TaxID=39947 RepID=B9FM91_ORYSJ|nr:hypothetical protein OsJ_16963 [Oryza sativa Japonica Group]
MAPPPPPPPPPPILLLLLLLLAAVAADVSTALCFDYATLTLGSLKLLGDAHLKNGTIRLSRDLPVPNSGAGRALYATPVALRGGFSTQFAFTVATLNADSVGGGLAFVLASDGVTLGDAGPYIGVSAASDVAAVEFDTLMDVQFGDVNGNHVGLDLGSMVSAAVADLDGVGVELTSGRTVNAWIEYSPKSGMEVFVSYSPKRPAEPVLSAPLDLGEYVKGDAFVGFSASTQGSTEMHAVEWWTFSTPTSSSSSPSKPSPRMATPSSPPPEAPVSSAAPPPASLNPMLPSPPQLPGVSTTTPSPPASTVSMPPTNSVAVASAPANSTAGISNAGSPHPPAHAAVAGAATAGAFVAVSFAGFALWALARRARARRRGTTALAAVADKRDSLASAAALARSPREFTYKELSAATRGFDASRVIGNGAFGTVNVMLDDAYRARLGDFGLARQAEHGESPDATAAAGTMGYLAPEYLLTGARHGGHRRVQLRRAGAGGQVLDAVDARLRGEYDEAEMRRAMLVGLACSSPEPALRPGMRAVVQMLGGEADPADSVSDYNALGLNDLSDDSSSDSLSSSSLTSTLRKGGHDIAAFSSAAAGDAAR